jgi:hypothetical protein
MELVFDQRLGPDPLRGVENENTRLALYYRHIGNIPLAKKHLEMAWDVDHDLLASFIMLLTADEGGFGFTYGSKTCMSMYDHLVNEQYDPFFASGSYTWRSEHKFDWDNSEFKDLHILWRDQDLTVDQKSFLSKTKIQFLGRLFLAKIEIDKVTLLENTIWMACFGDSECQFELDQHEKVANQRNCYSMKILFDRCVKDDDLFKALDFINPCEFMRCLPSFIKVKNGPIFYKLGKILSYENETNLAHYKDDSIHFFDNVNDQCRLSCVTWVLCAKRIPVLCKDIRKTIARLVWETRSKEPDLWDKVSESGNVKKNKI